MKIAKYKILKKLGEGETGVVYKAFDENMERDVAIKVLSVEFAKPEVKKRFYREARSAGKLSHENITMVFELGEVDEKPYIVMEYLTGTDLAVLIEKREPITLNEKLGYALQICKGLAYSHSQYIIHGNIRPANVRILADGRVKIMGFGLTDPTESNLTGNGVLAAHYMSPEQIQDDLLDNRSEIFSFGTLFYELLSYKRPFDGVDSNLVMSKIVNEQPDAIDMASIDNISKVNSIISKCLEKNADKRYESFTEVIRDLDEVLRVQKNKKNREVDDKRKQIETLLATAENQLKAGRLRGASASIRKAAEIEPRKTQVLALRDRIETELEIESTNAFIQEKLKEAKILHENKQYEKTVMTIEEVLKIEPNHVEGLKLVEQAIEQSRFSEGENGDQKNSGDVTVVRSHPEQTRKTAGQKLDAHSEPEGIHDDFSASTNRPKNRRFLLFGAIGLSSVLLLVVVISMFLIPQFKESAEKDLVKTVAAQEKLEAENAQLKMLLLKEKADALKALANAETSYSLADKKSARGKTAFEQENYREARASFEMAAEFYELAAETTKKNVESRNKLLAEKTIISAKERLALAVRDSTVEMRMIASLTPAVDHASEDFDAAMAKLERGDSSYRTKNYERAVNYFRQARKSFAQARETAFRADSLMQEIDRIKPGIFQAKNDILAKMNTVILDRSLNSSYQDAQNSEKRADDFYVLGHFDSALLQYQLAREMYKKTSKRFDERIRRDREREAKEFIAQSEPPKPSGGLAAISKNLKYPKVALWAAIEGVVLVKVLVDVDGQVIDTEILKSLTAECDQAAVTAIKSVPWQPAIQQGKPVKLWIKIPITFKMK